MIKRVIGLLLAISLLAGLPLSVLAATDGEWEYTIEDGKAIVMGYNGSETVLSIPLVLGGYPVTSIGVSAFSGCISLKSVTIPNSVTCIRSSAFYNCSGLTNVTIPNSVTEIRNHAFFGCSALTNVTIPNSVTSIGSSAFYDCSGLKNLTIPNSVTSIGNSAFSGCSGLTSATIPNGVTIIEDSVFYNCSGLSSVTIPTGVTRIGSNAFSGCTGLTNVTIPNSVTSIGYFTFRNCSSLTSITIPKGVTSIGERAFEGCQSLTTLMVAADNSKFKSVDDVLFTKAGTQLIVCAGGKQGAYTIPTGVANIGTWAFSGCISLTSVAIPTSVTSIGNGAFYNCSGLTDVYYAGSKAEWDQITIYSANDPVARATIHFDSIAGPSSDNGPAIPYIDEHGGAFSCDAYTIVTSSCTSWANGWYVVKDKLTISSRVGITGIVCLLLCDGAELIAEKGICVSSGNTLVIYGQSINSGVLKCNNIADNAGIGGNSYSTCGTITINGGTVISEYTSGAGSAGIGGGRRSDSGLITINGGNITASGAPGASAIGGGSFGDGNVIINGGVVNAKAKNEEYAGAGIGGGECAGFSVTITGGMINAEGSNTGTNYSSGASAIGGGTLPAAGTVTISGGSITATGANAINGGKNTVISILGGNIVANARVGTAYGDCIIQLDWTRRTDSIHVAEYSGNISMLKSFVLESNGEEATLNNINGATIVPTHSVEGENSVLFSHSNYALDLTDNTSVTAVAYIPNGVGQTSEDITWSTSDSAIVTIAGSGQISDRGGMFAGALVQAQGEGTATITIQIPDGRIASCNVIVRGLSSDGNGGSFGSGAKPDYSFDWHDDLYAVDAAYKNDNLVITMSALAKLAYDDFGTDSSGPLTINEYLDAHGKDTAIWKTNGYDSGNYEQFYRDVVGDYYIVSEADDDQTSGFYAVCFRSPNGKYIISFRGSTGDPFSGLLNIGKESNNDWGTDLTFVLMNQLTKQFSHALSFYRIVETQVGAENIVLTGHSLGGALAAYVSICTEAPAFSIDGAVGHVVDTTFWETPFCASEFKGVDSFNFVNLTDTVKLIDPIQIINSGDGADVIQAINANMYPMITYDSPHPADSIDMKPSLIGKHSVFSVLDYNSATGRYTLGSRSYTGKPITCFSHEIKNYIRAILHPSLNLGKMGKVWLGTTGNDIIKVPISEMFESHVMFGGIGSDMLTGFIGPDVLVAGGSGSVLDGQAGADTYIIDIESGFVTIHDPCGNDAIYLKGWDSDVSITKDAQSVCIADTTKNVIVSRIRAAQDPIPVYLVEDSFTGDDFSQAVKLCADLFSTADGGGGMGGRKLRTTTVLRSNDEAVAENKAIVLEGVADVYVLDAAGNRLSDEPFSNRNGNITEYTDYAYYYGFEESEDHNAYAIIYLFNEGHSVSVTSEKEVSAWIGDYDSESAEINRSASVEDVIIPENGTLEMVSAKSNDSLYLTDSNGKTDRIENVLLSIYPDSVSFPQSDITVNRGESFQLRMEVTPQNALSDGEWFSSNSRVVSVENGLLTAQSGGTAEIVFTTANGKQAICNVSVPKIEITVTYDANGGSGSMGDNILEGEYILPVCTLDPPSGKQFSSWEISTVLFSPGDAVFLTDDTVISACWVDKTYSLTVANGHGSAEYTEGQPVIIAADEPGENERFTKWVGVDGLTFTDGDATSSTAEFIMPPESVVVVAIYEDISGSSSGNINVSIPLEFAYTGVGFDISVHGTIESGDLLFAVLYENGGKMKDIQLLPAAAELSVIFTKPIAETDFVKFLWVSSNFQPHCPSLQWHPDQ